MFKIDTLNLYRDRTVAVSRDLHVRYGGPLRFGDTIYTLEHGSWIVRDLMNDRYTSRIDFLMPKSIKYIKDSVTVINKSTSTYFERKYL